jgi:hypothetical protein
MALTITFLQGWIVSPEPNPNLEDQASVLMTPRDRVAQLYPQALGTHFSCLLRHAYITVGLFFNPGHHTGLGTNYRVYYYTESKEMKAETSDSILVFY